MELAQMKEKLKIALSEERYAHSVGVMECASWLAGLYGADVKKAEVAGLVHDCAKELEKPVAKEYLKKLSLDDVILQNKGLWHGPVGTIVAREEYGVTDEETLDAIYYHTIGRSKISLLSKIVYMADMLEINRDKEFSWVPAVRKKAERDLDGALMEIIDHTLRSILDRELMMHPNAVTMRNEILISHKGR